MWSNTLNNKDDELTRTYGFTIVLSVLVFASVVAFSEYFVKDVPIVILLVISVLGCSPYIEIAQVKNNASFFKKRLTLSNWKYEIKSGEYDVLSSNLNLLNVIFPVTTTLCLVLFFVHKIFGDEYVNFNTILILLLIQIPFNTFFGWNPLATTIMRQHVSKHVSQADLQKYLAKNNQDRSTSFVAKLNTPFNATPLQNIMSIKSKPVNRPGNRPPIPNRLPNIPNRPPIPNGLPNRPPPIPNRLPNRPNRPPNPNRGIPRNIRAIMRTRV